MVANSRLLVLICIDHKLA